MWWQIYMDDDEGGVGGESGCREGGSCGDGEEKNRVILSTAPHWAHPTPDDMQVELVSDFILLVKLF